MATALVTFFTAGGAIAQSGTEPYAPSEEPPAGFEGHRYVDTAGCVFLREDAGGTVAWKPRLARDRTPICGDEPTFPDGPPAELLTAKTPEAVAPEIEAPEAETPEPQVAEPQVAEPAEAPPPAVAEPVEPEPAAVAEPEPAAVAEPEVRVGEVASLSRAEAAGGRYIQVGAFVGMPRVDRAAAKLFELGFGAAVVEERARGRKINTVLAGPFDDPGALAAALQAVRRAGFSDAFPRP
ncbi:SPOR domain-containing protein [Defluviimonas salinarum]|uniref:SPOR domain-containing protein n=1 Tax=Defluviimonas salinarum TaxID=2992147 RepID=A0ABT3J8V7_9RHOB|nr:SPOR domain-containing protein [Defluviimonas salinarum]MCW3784095.1 SPOR domain-containing protein [Defluviimonas salinarum]